LPRDAAVNAVSEPEKNPDITSSNKITPQVIQKLLSSDANVSIMSKYILYLTWVM
jgi:hypothetical protein